MAIEFKCPKCSKALFAQEEFAGRPVTCPACLSKFTIPEAPVVIQPAPQPEVPAAAATIEAPAQPKVEIKPDENLENQTRRCPYCAETIQAAARKCRFCGEYLDESLRRDDELKRLSSAAVTRDEKTARSVRIWRSLSILATSLTSGWMTWLTIGYIWSRIDATPGDPLVPWPLIIFNVALMFGLFRLVRAMRTGPGSVFASAAFAIVCCMPLNVALGMPMPTVAEVMKQNPMAMTKDLTQEQLDGMMMLGFGFIGFLFSLPVWFTALKLAAQARIARMRKS